MVEEDIRRYSMDELVAMRARGETYTDPNAPTFELEDDFWDNAYIVDPKKPKETVSLRVDPDILEWFRAQGKGHLTRMHAVLRSYVESQKRGGQPSKD